MRETAGSAAVPAARCRNRRPESWRLAPRQPHCEHRTLARLACHSHIAAHHSRKLAGNRKSKTSAAEPLCGGRLGLAEFLEKLRLLLRRHADATVGDGDLDPIASIVEPSRLELDLAFLCELAGIAQ